jgi:Ca2+-binding RTX toxin-like protein
MGGKGRTYRLIALFGTVALWAFPSPAHAVPGPQFDSIDAGVSYFLATNAFPETESNDASDTDFTNSDRSFDESFSSNEGTATSRVREMTHLDVVNPPPEEGDTVNRVHSIGKAAVRAIAVEDTGGVPVADGTADLDFSFSVVDQPTPYVINASTIVNNTDDDDCSESRVTLEGDSTIYEKYRNDGGDCGDPPINSGSASGVLPVGSYELTAEAYAAVAADYDAANGTSDYTVSLWLFPPCTHESDDTGETINASSGNDVICAEGGADTINAKGGDDIILTGKGSDVVNAGAGDDDIFGAEGNDVVNGGAGADLLVGDVGDDELNAGDDGDGDFPTVNPPTSGVFGGAGDDKGDGGSGKDFIDGGQGEDVFFGGTGPDAMAGGTENDRMIGQGENDLIATGDGADVANGGGGADDILTQAGPDKAVGGPGDDELKGGTQDDELHGDDGEDEALGGPGGDEIVGGDQKDVLRGEEDNDKILAKDGAKDTVSGGPGGNDRARRDAGLDVVSGIETFI